MKQMPQRGPHVFPEIRLTTTANDEVCAGVYPVGLRSFWVEISVVRVWRVPTKTASPLVLRHVHCPLFYLPVLKWARTFHTLVRPFLSSLGDQKHG